MRVLHYSLGFPPYRSGGLTKFCIDLMKQQIKDGHDVALMWPGQMGFVFHDLSIKDNGKEKHDDIEIQSFEVINPLPISYDEGIKDFDKFIALGDIKVYKEFVDMYKPDVVHIHTLMGLHKSFLIAVKERVIRLVFTAHDFFPICPKVTMFRHGEICNSACSCEECGVCNATALSIIKIRIMQSPLYRWLKDWAIIKKLRKQHRDEYLSESTLDDNAQPVGEIKDFKRIRMHYKSMLEMMDIVHYNSSVTKEIYEQNFGVLSSTIISISHANISDCRKIKKFRMRRLEFDI